MTPSIFHILRFLRKQSPLKWITHQVMSKIKCNGIEKYHHCSIRMDLANADRQTPLKPERFENPIICKSNESLKPKTIIPLSY